MAAAPSRTAPAYPLTPPARPDLRHVLLAALTAIDTVACILLGLFALWHIRMALRNQTSLHPDGEARYDLGAAANWRAVFGRRLWLWPLPMWLDDAPEGDGVHFGTRAPSHED